MSDITQFLITHGGPVLFAIVFAEQAGLPLPAAPWLLAAGALSASAKLNPALAIGATTVAALMADSIWFYVGRRGGPRVLRLFCRMSLSRNSCVGRTKNVFARHGLEALAAAKFIPGLGAVMPPLAGALGMSIGRFLLFDGVGSLFYASFYFTAGFLLRDQLSQAISVLNHIGFSALVLALALVVGYVAFKYARRIRPLRKEPVPVSCSPVVPLSAGGAYEAVGLNTLRLQNEPLATVASSSVRPSASPLIPHSL
jgi:membrane protein DedA with SNARE-associated domain